MRNRDNVQDGIQSNQREGRPGAEARSAGARARGSWWSAFGLPSRTPNRPIAPKTPVSNPRQEHGGSRHTERYAINNAVAALRGTGLKTLFQRKEEAFATTNEGLETMERTPNRAGVSGQALQEQSSAEESDADLDDLRAENKRLRSDNAKLSNDNENLSSDNDQLKVWVGELERQLGKAQGPAGGTRSKKRKIQAFELGLRT